MEGVVAISDKRGRMVTECRFSLERHHAGALLRAVDDTLRSTGFLQSDVRSIAVVPGPGTFSRVRLGVVTANALAWALGLPLIVHGKRVRIAKPAYGKPPSITMPSSSISERSERRARRVERSETAGP